MANTNRTNNKPTEASETTKEISTLTETNKETAETTQMGTNIEQPKERIRQNIDKNHEVPCRSVVDHKVYYFSPTGLFEYEWEPFTTEYVTYEQIQEIMKKAGSLFTKPYIVIEDAVVVNALPKVKQALSDYADIENLEKLLNKDNNSIRKALALIPKSMRSVLCAKLQYLVTNRKIVNASLIKLLEKDLSCELMSLIPEE